MNTNIENINYDWEEELTEREAKSLEYIRNTDPRTLTDDDDIECYINVYKSFFGVKPRW